MCAMSPNMYEDFRTVAPNGSRMRVYGYEVALYRFAIMRLG